ncbi:envelope glycoprotein O [Elephant endotheliotropic herpesvirus 5B]|nr:envelope glycoprotein O [Elephant endotheliotropic herpesvirus 5B]
MAVSETLITLNNLQSYMNTTSLNSLVPLYKRDVNHVCSNPASSFVQCYLRVLTLTISLFNKKEFNCSNETVQNIYNMTMPGVNLLTPVPICFDTNGDKKCMLRLSLEDIMYWRYRQALMTGPLKHCEYPWKYFRYLNEKVTNINMTKTPEIVNNTLKFIDTFVQTNLTMSDFIFQTIYSLVKSLGPSICNRGDTILYLDQYTIKRLVRS